jgi:hypothetical protein
METKVCKKCLIEKSLDEFYLEKRNLDGLMGSCKDCYNLTQKKWRLNNVKDVLLRDKKYREKNNENIIINNRKHYLNNVDKINERNRNWRKNNPQRSKEFSKNWKENNIEKIKLYQQIPEIKISHNMRCRIKQFLKNNNVSKKNKTFEIVGCHPEFLKEHLEKQFKEGMSWENYGLYGWHIDHIIPLSSSKTEEEIYQLSHYTNLQPLWAEDNLKKGNKILKKI